MRGERGVVLAAVAPALCEAGPKTIAAPGFGAPPLRVVSSPQLAHRNRIIAVGSASAVVGISALKGSGVRDIVPAVVAAYGRWNWRATTGQLNAWVTAVRARHSAGAMGSALGRIKYVLQTSARPPHFVVFLGGSESLRMEHERGLLR